MGQKVFFFFFGENLSVKINILKKLNFDVKNGIAESIFIPKMCTFMCIKVTVQKLQPLIMFHNFKADNSLKIRHNF